MKVNKNVPYLHLMTERVPTVIEGESLTHQCFKDQCDFSRIVDTYALTGTLPGNYKQPLYGDFTAFHDYSDVLEHIRKAEESFSNLEPHIRQKFDNDPYQFMAYCEDPKNFEELVRSRLPKEPAKTGESEPS